MSNITSRTQTVFKINRILLITLVGMGSLITPAQAQFTGNTSSQTPATTWQSWSTSGPFSNQGNGYGNGGGSYGGSGYSSNYDCGMTVYAEGFGNGADGTQTSSILTNGNTGVGMGQYGVKAGVRFNGAVCPNQLRQREIELAQELVKSREQQIVTFRGYCLERISSLATANQPTDKVEKFCQQTITDMKADLNNSTKK
jgi:hypothetical protein